MAFDGYDHDAWSLCRVYPGGLFPLLGILFRLEYDNKHGVSHTLGRYKGIYMARRSSRFDGIRTNGECAVL